MTISRRHLISSASLGIVIPSVLAIPGVAHAQKLKRLVGAIEEDPAIINPGITSIISSFAAGCPVYSALTWMDEKGNLHPDLAEKWEVSPDALNYTFQLRRNVKWHDGTPFSAEDVKFSIENISKKLHPWGKSAFTSLIEVAITDPRTIVIRLERPMPALLSATTVSISAILPKHIWKDQDPLKSAFNRKPIGTGPFKLVEYKQGDRLIYRKNPDYYFPGQPAFDELVLRVMPDPSARVAALENGELDILYFNGLPNTEVKRVSAFPNIKIATTSQGAPAYLCTFNLKNASLSDVRVRHAISHAINRDFIRNAVMPGLADAMVGPIPSVLQLANKALKDYAFDTAKAKGLLDAAGLKPQGDGTRTKFRLLFNNSDVRANRIADIIREQLGQVGVNVELQPLERATLMQKAYVSGDFEMLVDSYLLGPDPAIGVERLYNSANRFSPMRPFTNNSNYANPEVDKLFAKEKFAVSLSQRKPVYDEIQKLIWAEVPILPLFSYRTAEAYNGKVVSNVFDCADGSKESFARARPV
jgi:peptide/nickel transport system substrate-binding protein